MIVEVHTPAAGGADPIQVEGGSDPEKSDSERGGGLWSDASLFGFGMTSYLPLSFGAVPGKHKAN